MNGKMDIALQEFISEGSEILQRVSEGLQSIEKGNKDPELLSSIYRDMHTLKGTAQLFGYQNIGKLSHVLEASLDPIRKKKLSISARLHECCFMSLDLLGKMLSSVQNSKTDEGFTDEMLHMISLLIDAATHQFAGEINISKDSISAPDRSIKLEDVKKVEPQKKEIVEQPKPVMTNEITPIKPVEQKVVQPVLAVSPDVEKSHPAVQVVQDQTSLSSVPEATIRVQVSLLDNLMNMIGELVLVRNQVLQFKNNHEDAELISLSKNLDVVTTQLQTEVMKTRMQPISNVVSKFQRVVRDLSKDLGKQIDLTLEGAETELDKTLLEAIKDPMTHLVRNACDHGIETPSQRKTAGKPENGHLLIRSFHEGGHVVIEISDDGKGLDRKKLIAKAIEKNLLTPEKAEAMSEKEVYNIIFMPGFSTAQTVTAVSGRGVGMDVVKTNIEKIGGTIELSSTLGKGMSVAIKIPLTLAIVPALLIKMKHEKYAIPQVKLVELVRVESNEQGAGIEYLHGRPMLRLRGDLLALVDLRELTEQNENQKSQNNYSDTNIVVLNADGEIFGLIVDEISDTADIVVKPLSTFLKYLTLFSGATILGDGTVAIILDVMGLAMAANINTHKAKEIDPGLSNDDHNTKKMFDAQDFLLIDLGTHVTHAIPLCLVQRLEEFSLKMIEQSGNQKVVRYRDQLLPLLDLVELLGYESLVDKNLKKKEVESVVVVQRTGKYYGIKVREVLDIINIECDIDDSICDRLGILGNVVHQKSVIVVVDVLGLIEQKQQVIKKGTTQEKDTPVTRMTNNIERIKSLNIDMKSKKVRVLYAEDVAFFRKHVMKVLTDAGFEVTVYEDGAKALAALEKSYDNQFNLILSDIEMPKMDGLQFAQEVRKREKYAHIPMIALTTRFKQSDIDAGIKAGFTAYMEKLDPEKLLTKIAALMNLTAEDIRRVEV
jgi:two-component system chemotaxis sensor kinase CheA